MSTVAWTGKGETFHALFWLSSIPNAVWVLLLIIGIILATLGALHFAHWEESAVGPLLVVAAFFFPPLWIFFAFWGLGVIITALSNKISPPPPPPIPVPLSPEQLEENERERQEEAARNRDPYIHERIMELARQMKEEEDELARKRFKVVPPLSESPPE